MTVTINGSAGVTTNSGAVYDSLQRATAVASTSGTSIDFTSIPSWVRRITVMFQGVSTNGTSIVQAQIGAGSVTTSGYNSSSSYLATTTGTTQATTGFLIHAGATGTTILRSGHLILTNISSNIWVASGLFKSDSVADTGTSVGTVTLGGTLDRVRVTTVNGTDAFDAGTINIIYE